MRRRGLRRTGWLRCPVDCYITALGASARSAASLPPHPTGGCADPTRCRPSSPAAVRRTQQQQQGSLITSLPPLLPSRDLSCWAQLAQEPWLLLLEMLALAATAAAAPHEIAAAVAAGPAPASASERSGPASVQGRGRRSADGAAARSQGGDRQAAPAAVRLAPPSALLPGLLEALLPAAARQAVDCWRQAGALGSCRAAVAAQLLPLLFRCHLLQSLLEGHEPDVQLARAYAALPADEGPVVGLAGDVLQSLGLQPLAELLAPCCEQGVAAGGDPAAPACCQTPQLQLAQRPSFIRLPLDFSELYLRYVGKPCPACGKELEQPALCLATGSFVCSWWDGCSGMGGPTTAPGARGVHMHCLERCGGSSAFLLLSSSKVRRSGALLRWLEGAALRC